MKQNPILIVDDESDLRELLEITLLKMGLDSILAASLEEARSMLRTHTFSLILTDMRLPDGLGIELVREVASHPKAPPVAVLTAYGSADNAVAALKAGAFDYISKPISIEQLRQMIRSALVPHKNTRTSKNDSFNDASCLIGQSQTIITLRSQIARMARSMAPIAITGESGSGKELAAREIHRLSGRASAPFIAVNCGAIPETLMEAEFFGYRKGAFTGAQDEREGLFHAAHGGTLLLDEVADLPLAMQVKLLRAIQERRVRKIGATQEDPVDIRLISATHQNLADCVSQGKFRPDLYYRLNVIELHLPALRERRDDLLLLAEHILSRLSPTIPTRLDNDALAMLSSYPFPGNVRELENILERALAFANKGLITCADLALKHRAPTTPTAPKSTPFSKGSLLDLLLPNDTLPTSLPDFISQIECEIIERALSKTQHNRTRAAELLGLSFRQLRYQIQRLNIQDMDT